MSNRLATLGPLALLLLPLGCPAREKSSAPDANVSVVAPAAPDAAAAVDLLWATNAIVAVSSRVDNPRDIPSHIADHRPETAWNGKTGDLVGAWIAFRVPSDARVDYLLRSAGFDKQTEKKDLFFENHRIKKVRVLRDKKVLREVALSPDVRVPQRIEIGTNGGDFKIEVLEVAPGTNTRWRELTVSELAVFGQPGAHARAPGKLGPPVVNVGSLELSEVPYNETVGASYAAACKKLVEDDNAAADESIKGMGEDKPESATCGAPSIPTPGKGTILETAHVPVKDAPKSMYRVHFEGDVLAFKTAGGVALTNVRVSGKETAWFWTVTYKLLSEKWVDSQLVIEVDELRVTDSDGYAPPGHERDLHSETRAMLKTICTSDRSSCTTTTEPR